jgi:hypothetical protein
MIFRLAWLFVVVGWLEVGSFRASAAVDNPYAPIVARNIFGLVPIPTNNPADAGPPPIPPPKITPNGIMTLFGKLQVLFKVANPPKPGQPPKEDSYVLGVGERQDEIEVQKIDEPAATITFNNHGTIQELPLVAGTASGAGAAPAMPTFNFAPPPVAIPAPAAGGSGLMPTMGGGGRFGRARSPGSAGFGGGTPSGGSPAINFPGFGNSSSRSSASATAETQPAATPEEQILRMERQRATFLDQGNPAAAIIPPTPLTGSVTGEGETGAPSPGQ